MSIKATTPSSLELGGRETDPILVKSDVKSSSIPLYRRIALVLVFIFAGAFLGLRATYDNISREALPGGCLGAPYLYVTLREETSNILKYSRNGCLLSENIAVVTDVAQSYFDVAFRGMAFGTYKGREALFVADSSPHNARVVVFGQCDRNGQRSSEAIVVDSFKNPGVVHTEGIALDGNGNIYISNRNTDNVLRFTKDTFAPMPPPPNIQPAPEINYYDGTFIQFGAPKPHSNPDDAVRAVAYAEGKIWVASAELGGVALADVATGQVSNIIPMDGPIAMHYNTNLKLMFISCKSRNTGGIVYAISTLTMQMVHSYKDKNLFHPVGLATHENVLYVVENDIGRIFTFSIDKEELLEAIVKRKELGDLEHIILSNC